MVQVESILASIDLSQLSKGLQQKIARLESSQWRLSESIGGHLQATEPVFAASGDSIIVAYPSSVHVFSTKTSLLLRTLTIRDGWVTDIALGLDDSLLIVAKSSGVIEQWDWQTGELQSAYDSGSPVSALSVCRPVTKGQKGLVYTVHSGDKPSIKVINLGDSSSKIQAQTVLTPSAKTTKVKALEGGNLIIIASGKCIIVGTRRSGDDTSPSITYTWHELECADHVMCLDAYSLSELSGDVHVAVGTSSGQIHLYRNLVSQLKLAANKKLKTQPSVQKLHWHRFPVSAVHFSQDGNYLISGGFETVICKWQLDTGKREDLPHLTAPIEDLVVSPNGASYAIRLGNNSLIIISTLDYEPTFALSGPSLPTVREKDIRSAIKYPAIVRPDSTPTQMLLATPGSTSPSAPTSAVYLQTIDARTGAQLEKQALTRTNATDSVSDPQGRVLGEPDITHLAASADGQWLAVAEDWQPQRDDLKFTAAISELDKVKSSRRETYLKIWARDEENKNWRLISRIDHPHGSGHHQDGQILALATDGRAFITAGQDGEIKVWRPQARQRHGVQKKTSKGDILTSWHCARTIPRLSPPVVEGVTDKLQSARLALAADGTLLAAVFNYRKSTVVSLINYLEGTVILSRSDLYLSNLAGVAIVDRYLVLLSETLIVWDLVQDRLQFSYGTLHTGLSSAQLLGALHLAAHPSGIFAISVPGKESSEVIAFDPASSEPLTVQSLRRRVRALVPASGSRGFLIIDNECQIHRLSAPQTSLQSLLALPAQEDEIPTVEAAAPSSALQLLDLPLRSVGTGEDTEDGTDSQNAASQMHSGPTFTQDSLAEVFESKTALATSSTMSNFLKVAGLVLGGNAVA